MLGLVERRHNINIDYDYKHTQILYCGKFESKSVQGVTSECVCFIKKFKIHFWQVAISSLA